MQWNSDIFERFLCIFTNKKPIVSYGNLKKKVV